MTYNVTVNATGQNLAIDFDALPVPAQEFIIAYGLRQKFNDCHVSAPADDIVGKSALVDKTLAALQSGEIRIGAARTTDRVGSEIKRLATDLAKQRFKKDHGKLPKKPNEDERFVDFVATYTANEKVIAQAKANVAAVADLADLD